MASARVSSIPPRKEGAVGLVGSVKYTVYQFETVVVEVVGVYVSCGLVPGMQAQVRKKITRRGRVILTKWVEGCKLYR